MTSNVTQPLLQITNAVLAIGGGNYRDDMLEKIRDLNNGLGGLANAINKMAEAAGQREAALKHEIKSLENELHATRRRKLVLTSKIGADKE
jgi:nitrate/nitrite-specific signal transduction histidine kinase